MRKGRKEGSREGGSDRLLECAFIRCVCFACLHTYVQVCTRIMYMSAARLCVCASLLLYVIACIKKNAMHDYNYFCFCYRTVPSCIKTNTEKVREDLPGRSNSKNKTTRKKPREKTLKGDWLRARPINPGNFPA